LGDGTENGLVISLRPSLITAHHSVSSLSDPAREASPCSRYLRPARDMDTTCTVRRNVHESLATKVRAHRAKNLLGGCVGRSHVDHTDARNDFVGCFGRSDRSAQRLYAFYDHGRRWSHYACRDAALIELLESGRRCQTVSFRPSWRGRICAHGGGD